MTQAKDNVKPFFNSHYFEILAGHMKKNKLRFYEDEAGIVWHILDVAKIVKYHRKKAV